MTQTLALDNFNRVLGTYSKNNYLLASLRVHIAVNLTNLFELNEEIREQIVSVAYIVDSPEMYSAFSQLVQDTLKLIRTGDLTLLDKYIGDDLMVMKLSTIVYLKASSEFDVVKVSDSEEYISYELKRLAECWAKELI